MEAEITGNKEILEKVKKITKIPSGFLFYAWEKDNVVNIGALTLSLNESDRTNISRMNNISKRNGFKFWLISDEGNKWLKENSKIIGQALMNVILKYDFKCNNI